jgi:hypothetical protein
VVSHGATSRQMIGNGSSGADVVSHGAASRQLIGNGNSGGDVASIEPKYRPYASCSPSVQYLGYQYPAAPGRNPDQQYYSSVFAKRQSFVKKNQKTRPVTTVCLPRRQLGLDPKRSEPAASRPS